MVDPAAARTHVVAAQAALRSSDAYKQYVKNGTLSRTKIGLCDRELTAALADLTDTTLPVAAPPTPPITTIRDAPNAAVNLYLPAQNGTVVQDYAIDNCGDQSVLLQPNVTGCTVRRVYVSRPGQNPRDLGVSGALHALYLKSPGNLIEDFVADYSRNTGASLQTNALSVRKRDNVLRRTEVRGPVALAAAYFEEDVTKGVVTFDQGRWEFTGDCALWVDGAIQSFVLRGIHVNGPGLLARFKNHTGDFVRVEGCTVSGRPATEADVAGARGLTVV